MGVSLLANTYSAIVALNEYLVPFQLLHNPPSNEGRLWIFDPNIALPGEVVLAFDAFNCIIASAHLLRFDE